MDGVYGLLHSYPYDIEYCICVHRVKFKRICLDKEFICHKLSWFIPSHIYIGPWSLRSIGNYHNDRVLDIYVDSLRLSNKYYHIKVQ